jgi:hypothetical protein
VANASSRVALKVLIRRATDYTREEGSSVANLLSIVRCVSNNLTGNFPKHPEERPRFPPKSGSLSPTVR